MRPPTILVLAALATEAAALHRALRGRPGVEVRTIGVGGARLAASGGLADASWAVVAGLGGGLDPTLRAGDVVIDAAPPGFDPARGGWRAGRVLTAEAIAATPEAKAAWFERTGASVVDMEQAVVARAAGPGGPGVVGVRAVLDPADATLPAFLGELVDDRGSVRPWRVASRACRRPSSLITLGSVGAASSRGLRRLAPAVTALIEHLHASAPGARTEPVGTRPHDR